MKPNKKADLILEIMVVVAILAVVATFFIPSFSHFRTKVAEVQTNNDIKEK
ncbi:MAG: hypothetical protein OYH77_01950 [Pseudomonadota bacterium]|nr:hypothetical protein [Pseudomonadota bacterium]